MADNVRPDGRRQRPRKLKNEQSADQTRSGDDAEAEAADAEATQSAARKGSKGVDGESKGESWDVLHGVKGMKKTKTGRYIADDANDGDDAIATTPDDSAQ